MPVRWNDPSSRDFGRGRSPLPETRACSRQLQAHGVLALDPPSCVAYEFQLPEKFLGRGEREDDAGLIGRLYVELQRAACRVVFPDTIRGGQAVIARLYAGGLETAICRERTAAGATVFATTSRRKTALR